MGFFIDLCHRDCNITADSTLYQVVKVRQDKNRTKQNADAQSMYTNNVISQYVMKLWHMMLRHTKKCASFFLGHPVFFTRLQQHRCRHLPM